MGIRTTLALVLATLCTACGGSTVRYVALNDVDPTLGAKFGANKAMNAFADADGKDGPDREEFRISWVDLCTKDPCAPTAQKYTQLFRDTAIIIATLREVEFIVDAVAAGELSVAESAEVLKFARRQLPQMVMRVKSLAEVVLNLSPTADFSASPMLAPKAAKGIVAASTQLKDAAKRIPVLASKVMSGQGEGTAVASSSPPGADVVTASAEPNAVPGPRLHPTVQRRLGTLRGQLEQLPAYAPTGELTEDEVLSIATVRGLAVLEQEMKLYAQLEVDVAPRLLVLVVEGPEEPVLGWYEARRSAVEQCLQDNSNGTVSVAALYDASGKITGAQTFDTTFDAPVSDCIGGQLRLGDLRLPQRSAGMFTVRLTTEPPEAPVDAFLVPEPTGKPLEAADTISPAPTDQADVAHADPISDVPALTEPHAVASEPTTPQIELVHLDAAPPARRGNGIALMTGIIGGGFVAAGAVLGTASLLTRSETMNAIRTQSISEVDALAAQKRHNSLATWSLVTGGAGVGLLATSTFIALTRRSEVSALSINGTGIELTWRFE